MLGGFDAERGVASLTRRILQGPEVETTDEHPNWKRWFEMASVSDPRARQGCQIALSFREELHAIEAILAGQGIALCSDVVVADDIASGALIKAFDLSLPGYGYYPVYASNHPRRATIDVFVQWISTAARREMVPRAGRSSIHIGKE